MAGHSKFKNIMYRKGAQDRKRAQTFAKLGKEIMVATKLGGSDPASNARLRLAIQSARAERMPKDNIERAIQKGDGGADGADYVEIQYEGYGPGGVAIIVEVMTDNRNRAAAEIRAIFGKNGGNLGESGSVAFLFDRVGEIAYPAECADSDTMFEAALEAGARDIESDPEAGHLIVTEPGLLFEVSTALEQTYGAPDQFQLAWQAKTLTPVEADKAQALLGLIDKLEDNDDVQKVTANYSIDPDLLAEISES